MNRKEHKEIFRVLNQIRFEKPIEVTTVKLQHSLRAFLRKHGKASAFIRQAVLEKLERLALQDE